MFWKRRIDSPHVLKPARPALPIIRKDIVKVSLKNIALEEDRSDSGIGDIYKKYK